MNIFNTYLQYINETILILLEDNNIVLENDNLLEKIVVEVPKDKKFGDLSTNAALVLSSTFKTKPLDVAKKLKLKFENHHDFCDVCIANPGFINFTLQEDVWQKLLFNLLETGEWKYEQFGKNNNLNLEFVSANPTGPLHAGHARGAVVGDCLARILKLVGFNVTREYYINDAGNQIDVLIKSVQLRYLEQLSGINANIPENFYPGAYLIRIAKKIKNQYDDTLEKLDYENFFLKVNQLVINEILNLIKKDLLNLGVEMDIFSSEKSIIEKGFLDKVLNILKDNKLIYEGILEKPKGKADLDEWEPRPQLLFKSSLFGDDSDRALKKSDGSWTYFANDMAYHLYKIEKTKGNLINVLGADHLGYLKRIESAVKALSSNKIKLVNKVCAIVHLMNDDKKIKMSKRSGNFIMLSDLVNDLGKDVIRFIMLTRKNEQVLEFDFKKALAQNKDNPVFYVHYAYARCKSIVKNSNIFDQKFSFEEIKMLKDSNELSVIKLISQWPRVVELSAKHMEPHRICYYLIELASEFHSLWNKGKVDESLKFIHVDDTSITKSKLALINSIMLTIKSGLNILSINPMEEM
ncbi:MAG: arginine--tRNA ligase [Candidatus Puniceispirillales bacterium]